MRLAKYFVEFCCSLVVALFLFAIYWNNIGTKSQAHQLEGSKEERIDIVEGILLRNLSTNYHFDSVGQSVVVTPKSHDESTELPSGIDEAFLVEETTVSGFAPSEIKSFFAFRVPKDKISNWTERFTEMKNQDGTQYVEPETKKQWWVDRALFSELELYESRQLTGKSEGWVGVDMKTGTIYAYSMDL